MSASDVVTASFTSSRSATAAVDWFLNQAIERDAVSVRVAARGEQPRSPGPGDNRRADLTWSVSVDLARAPLKKRIVVETMRREGGRI
jgi:hypothetical protein